MKMLMLETSQSQSEIVYVPADISEITILARNQSIFTVFLILKDIPFLTITIDPLAESAILVVILTQLHEKQQQIIQTIQMHAKQQSKSSSILKAVVRNEAQLRYEGKVIITQEGRFSEAHQQSKCLLVGTAARAFTAPQLEIETHEVQCTHGSALSRLSEDHLILCNARGINEPRAQQLIIEGFFTEGLPSSIKNEILSFLCK